MDPTFINFVQTTSQPQPQPQSQQPPKLEILAAVLVSAADQQLPAQGAIVPESQLPIISVTPQQSVHGMALLAQVAQVAQAKEAISNMRLRQLQALQVGLQDNIKTRQQAAQMHAKLLQLPENNRPTIDQLFAAGPCPHVTRWEDKQVWGTLLERFKNTIMPTDREVFERMLREGFEKITGLWLNPLGPASSGNSFTNKLKVSAMTWENNIIPELLKRYDEWRTKFLEGGK